MQKGKIGVTSENIFPIIKKFLYSDHEIFLREIVSNAVDATQKMAAVAASGEYKGELGDTTVRVKLDKGKKKITQLLNKYCKFLPVPIGFGKEQEWKEDKMVDTGKDKIINNTKPAWTRKPVDLKDEDYRDFYHELYPVYEEPLFYIHLNVDYPFNLTGILYFPKIKNNIEIQKNKIQLYCNQVFVTDSVEGIVPEFLTLLHGVIDSPDIPLNVSRSYLQGDPNVKKISSHITKKVADKLQDIFKNQRNDFEKKWDDLKVFIQYGMITDEKFYERAEKFVLLKNV